MAGTVEGARHAPLSVVEKYLVEGVTGAFGVDGSPLGRILVDSHRSALAAQVRAEGRTPDLVDFENLSTQAISEDGVPWQQLLVQLDDNTAEVYALLCSVLDRVQLYGESFADAVESALESLTGILAVRSALTRERQVGMFGELLVLLALADDLGPDRALEAWRGPDLEEHDFGLADADLEVKSTLSERRDHWISTPTQLTPTSGRQLYLVSVQLTAAALDEGFTLAGLVAKVRSRFDGATRLEAALRHLGYRDRDAELYRSRWVLRTPAVFYEVDDDFPALTQKRLEAVVPSPNRVTDVRYRIDLTGARASLPLFPLASTSSGGSK